MSGGNGSWSGSSSGRSHSYSNDYGFERATEAYRRPAYHAPDPDPDPILTCPGCGGRCMDAKQFQDIAGVGKVWKCTFCGGLVSVHTGSILKLPSNKPHASAPSLVSSSNPPRSSPLPRPSALAAAAAEMTKPVQKPITGTAAAVDTNPRKDIVITADNVIVVVLDITGSLHKLLEEVFLRLITLYKEAQLLLGGTLQMVFIAHGDSKHICQDPFYVTPAGSGPVLDDYLRAVHVDAMGGGDEEESAELALLHIDRRIDVSSVKNAYAFVVTDEKAAPHVDPALAESVLGLKGMDPFSIRDLFQGLLTRWEPFVLLKKTDIPHYAPRRIERFWVEAAGRERVAPLPDGRRIVDIMLGLIAKTTHQYENFSVALARRQNEPQFRDENIAAVHASCRYAPSGPTEPKVRVRAKVIIPKAS